MQTLNNTVTLWPSDSGGSVFNALGLEVPADFVELFSVIAHDTICLTDIVKFRGRFWKLNLLLAAFCDTVALVVILAP